MTYTGPHARQALPKQTEQNSSLTSANLFDGNPLNFDDTTALPSTGLSGTVCLRDEDEAATRKF